MYHASGPIFVMQIHNRLDYRQLCLDEFCEPSLGCTMEYLELLYQLELQYGVWKTGSTYKAAR
jgi:hypothetical protein